ncbi:MAG: hypothetical protein H6865_00305 [Rhodospirillales bacterium]|nr:hypothetical protein [Alphaproteobacteria bacterium]MCB9986067.1 hypothetical protein [Rhodospirillales bacterium]USO07366.1 MAG: hypothetical protein H6866_08070 [Rhodospirillales bacterium]
MTPKPTQRSALFTRLRAALARRVIPAALAAMAGFTPVPSQAGFFDFLHRLNAGPEAQKEATQPGRRGRRPLTRRVANIPQVHARAAHALAAKGFKLGAPVFVRVFKQAPGFKRGALELWIEQGGEYKKFKDFPILAWSGGIGGKRREGDRQAPEGYYPVTSAAQFNPYSREYISINTAFPNARDRAQGYTGNALMIHGGAASIGCYAIGDDAMEIVYAAIEAAFKGGQSKIMMQFMPMPMTDAAMAQLAKTRAAKIWMPVWKELKAGYDIFAATRRPPEVSVQGAHYAVRAQGGKTMLASNEESVTPPLPPVRPDPATLSGTLPGILPVFAFAAMEKPPALPFVRFADAGATPNGTLKGAWGIAITPEDRKTVSASADQKRECMAKIGPDADPIALARCALQQRLYTR